MNKLGPTQDAKPAQNVSPTYTPEQIAAGLARLTTNLKQQPITPLGQRILKHLATVPDADPIQIALELDEYATLVTLEIVRLHQIGRIRITDRVHGRYALAQEEEPTP